MTGVVFAAGVMLFVAGAVEVRWDTATLRLSDAGRVEALVDNASGRNVAVPGMPFCRIITDQGAFLPTKVSKSGENVVFSFADGASITYRVSVGRGHSLWEMVGWQGLDADSVGTLRLCELNLDGLKVLGSSLNAYYDDTFAAAVMATSINVLGSPAQVGARGGNATEVTHTFTAEREDVKEGRQAARYAATSAREAGDGWSVRGRSFTAPVDLTGLTAIKAWVHGDGKGQMLKIQLFDGKGGYRDDYIKVDFIGWREVVCDQPAADVADHAHITQLNFYYNGLPANTSVECLIDAVRAVVETPQGVREVMLEDFEDDASELWEGRGVLLRAEAYRKYGIFPAKGRGGGAGFGIIACPRRSFEEAIDAFERAAGLPNPHPGGVWSKVSPWTKRSYLFITSFGEKDTEDVIRWAKRGGFPMVLIGGESWSKTHGHHEINTDHFPDGLVSLQRTAEKLRAAGLRVGLHFLAAAVYVNDPYVYPKPDPRLFKNAWAELASDIDEKADFIPTVEPPTGFPKEDGGYTGDGTYLQIGDELIHYATLSLEPPYGFAGCQRGTLRTEAAAHRKGDKIAHVQRSYGYFLYDLDTDMAEEVIGNVCRAANAINADMLYFDGSEWLQGDHWYYNAKLQAMYYERLRNKDALLQGSSYSHYSWHLISRMASADGHGDVKAYLDQRIPWFEAYERNLMPLDIGWYYVYDPEVTADQFEYILQKCLGFGASISVQTNPAQLREHPEMGAIFDLVNTYERLRLSGKVPEAVRERLREPGREYRLLRNPLRLRRTVFGPWQEVTALDGEQNRWVAKPEMAGARVGVQIRCGRMTRPGAAYEAPEAIVLETFDDLAPYLNDPQNKFDVFVIGPGKAGSTKEGVTQEFASVEDGAVVGKRCGRYTATSTLGDNSGWSAIGKRFDPPLDLSAYKAIGLWLRGDGNGGAFKVQLRQGPNAKDYYITNNFTEWRYFQLLRTEGHEHGEIDYSRIDYLIFYYNGLPARKTVTCWIDDVKALMAVDAPALVDPEIQVGEKRIVFRATLHEGERLVYFPGEVVEIIPARQEGGDDTQRRRVGEVEAIELKEEAAVVFSCKGPLMVAAKVRLVQDCPEELALPEEALRTRLE